MKQLCLTLNHRGYADRFYVNMTLEPSTCPELFVYNSVFEKSRGLSWKVFGINPQNGTVLVQRPDVVVNGTLHEKPQGVFAGSDGELYAQLGNQKVKITADATLPRDACYIVPSILKCTEMIGGNKHCTIASNEYASISFDAWEASEKASNAIRGCMPTTKEMSDELCKELRRLHPGVELCEVERPGKYTIVKMDPQRCFLRDHVYGKATVRYEEVVAGDIVGEVRGACFETARLLASLIKKTIDERVCGWGPPPGASVSYTHAMVQRNVPVAVRFLKSAVDVIKSHDQPDSFAFYDHQTDSVCWRLRSYFTVTPVGEEVEGDDA